MDVLPPLVTFRLYLVAILLAPCFGDCGVFFFFAQIMAAFQSNMSSQDIALTVQFFTLISSNWSLKFLHLQDEEVVTWPELHFGLFD